MNFHHRPKCRSVWATLRVKISRRKQREWIGIFKPAESHSWCYACCYPTIRSTGGILSLLCFFVFHSQPGLYQSAWNFTWRFGLILDRFSFILGDSPRDGRVLGVNRGHMAGSASCWSICPVCIFLSLSSSAVLVIVMYRRAAVDCNIVSVMCFLAALLVHIVMWNVKQDWLFALWAYAAESCQVDDGKLR